MKKRDPLTTIALALFLIVFCIVTYWLWFPYKPMVIAGPIKILNENGMVCPGERLIYELDMDKRMPLPATISKQLVDGVITTYAPIIGNLPVGKYKRDFSIQVPIFSEPGTYRFKWEGQYRVNPMRIINVIAWSEPFEVCE